MSTLDCSWLTLWFLLEINTISFLLILIKRRRYVFGERVVKYFLFQAITSVFLFLRLRYKYWADSISAILVYIKLGIFPFHIWFIRIVGGLDPVKLILLRTTQKILPFRLYQILELRYFDQFLLIIRLVGGALYARSQIKLIRIVGASGVYSTSWIILYFNNVGSRGWVYVALYFFLTRSFVLILVSFNYWRKKNIYLSLSQLISVLLVLLLSAFPPSPLFFFKIILLSRLFKIKFLLILTICLLIDPLIMYIYINLLINFWIKHISNY